MMAYCVTADPITGVLSVNSTPLSACVDYVILTNTEFTEYPTLVDIFAMPTAGDLGQMWGVFFSLPLILYLTAWAFGVVINWFKPRQEEI